MSKNWSPKLFSTLPVIDLLMHPSLYLYAGKETNNSAWFHRHMSGSLCHGGEGSRYQLPFLYFTWMYSQVSCRLGWVGDCLITDNSTYDTWVWIVSHCNLSFFKITESNFSYYLVVCFGLLQPCFKAQWLFPSCFWGFSQTCSVCTSIDSFVVLWPLIWYLKLFIVKFFFYVLWSY